MMKKVISLFFSCLCFFCAIAQKNNEAQIYHDQVLAEVILVSAALNNFNASLETDSAYLMHSSRAQLKKQLDSSLVHINQLGSFQKNDDWNHALHLQFKFYSDCIDKEYVKFIDYSIRLSVLTEDEIADFTKMISKLNNKEVELSEIVNETYKEFVKKYKVIITK